jgi:putative proteasome-type protease
MRVREGLLGLADTRVTSGNECIKAKKVSVYQGSRSSVFVMTSGLRSVRDKALTYFDEHMETREEPFDRLFKCVNVFAQQVRRVAEEDKRPLAESGLPFDMHALIGGQMANDKDHKLYLIYPQGNWVEIGVGTPFSILGTSSYGKPVLDRTLKYDDSIRFALKVGSLAFDSTRISAADVDFPLDVVLYRRDSFSMTEHRLEYHHLEQSTSWWQEQLRLCMRQLPSEWIDESFPEFSGMHATDPTGDPSGGPPPDSSAVLEARTET